LNNAFVDSRDVDLLAVGSTQGDLPLPGLASMVQSELDIPACEIVSTHGVCSSGIMALKAAFNQVRLGEKQNALVCASELSSRLLKKSRYEAAKHESLDLEAEFLRWMLSDGAGAFLVQPRPRPRGMSLRIDWIDVISYASDFDLCMSCGTADQSQWASGHYAQSAAMAPSTERLSELQISARRSNTTTMMRERSWQDYETYADNIVKVGVEGFLRLIKQGKVRPEEIDYFVCHYSSHTFRGKIVDLLTRSGCMVPEEKWFTNLYTKGNTGCASIFIALDELYQSGQLQDGQTLFCTIPESGRFTTAYMKLTVVGGKQ
jgi:3-oxoacyl-[acyl-carrier-protein] synthase III